MMKYRWPIQPISVNGSWSKRLIPLILLLDRSGQRMALSRRCTDEAVPWWRIARRMDFRRSKRKERWAGWLAIILVGYLLELFTS